MTATSMCRIRAAHAFAWLAALAAPLTAIAAERGASARVEVATGVVSVVRPDNSASLVGVGYALQPGEAVRTERDSTARVRFSDGTDVVLRPSSQIRIDDYRFDRAQPQSDSFALRLLKGGLRTITGAIAQRNRERVSYGTPTVTIGVRGTDFVMRWCEDDCAREERVAGAMRLPDAAVARLGAMSGGVSALRPDGRWRALDAGDAIYADDAIVTGPAGVAVLFFLDDTRITLQPRSILVIDDYFYDAAAPGRNRVVLALLDGAARTQTGAIAKTSPERFVFLTPERRIRVHGTLFDTVVQVVTGAAETAGEQAGQAAQQTADATKKAADKAADAGQQAAQETTVALQNTNTKISQGQQAVSSAGAKATQAANDAISNPPAVETTPTPSGGPSGKIPVPTADVDIGQAAREVGSSVAKAAQQVGDTAKQVVEAGSNTAAENWRGTTGAVSDAASTVRDTSTRVVERVVTWTGGKISTTVDAGVAAGEATAGAGARTVDYVYDAAGRVVTIGRGVADSATAATRDAVDAAAAATEHALAVVIPAIIGVAKDATDSSAGTAVRDGIGTAAAVTDRAVAVVVPAVTDVIKEVKDQTGADGRGSGTIATPPGAGDRVAGRGFEAAAGTLPTARTGGDGTGASGALAAGAGSGGKVATGDTGLTGGEKALPVAPARTAPFTGETAQQGASTAGKEGTGDAARAREGGEKIAPAPPVRTAPFSGETARPDAAAVGKEGSGGTARQDGGGSKALPTSPPATSQAASDTARQDSAATSAARGTAVGAGGGVSVTAVQVHEGAVTMVDSTGELAVRRGSLVVSTDAGPMKARFDGVVASTAPNPASFVVDGRLFGAAAGDAPAAGLYTLVRSGRIALTRDGREVVLDPGEAGYANDAGGAPTRLREIPRFLDADRYLAIAFDPSSLMCGPATPGMPGVRTNAIRGAVMSAAVSAAAGLPGTGSWGLPGSRAAPTDSAGYRDAVGAAHFAATSGMSAAMRAAYWGAFDAADVASRADVSGRSGGAGMTADGVGVRGVGPTAGSFGAPASGFAGGNSPGRGAAASFRDGGKWIGGQRYGGTFAAGRRGLTRSGDISIGAGDGSGDYRGSGGGNAASGFGNPNVRHYIDVAKTPTADGSPTAIPFPTWGGEAPAKTAPSIGIKSGSAPSRGDEAGVLKGVASTGTGDKPPGQPTGTSPVLVDGTAPGPGKNTPAARERDDVLGGGDVIVVLNRGDAGQLASAIRRQIGAITGAAGGAGDGRTDQQTTTGGGPMIVDRGAQADAKRGSTSGGAVSFETMFRINQYVNPGAQ